MTFCLATSPYTGQNRTLKTASYKVYKNQGSRTLLTPQGDGNDIYMLIHPAHITASRTLLTPQGDGNPHKLDRFRGLKLLKSRTLLTPQGDGNLGFGGLLLKPNRRRPAPSLPRKGTETASSTVFATNLFIVPHPPYPARGRKRRPVIRTIRTNPGVPHPPYPARGRKPHEELLPALQRM